ncbi:MAG: hypothetical protein DHS20C18_53810 [Saprospiraceae bacterium]|nr:MAG: hypothetical protein DHS20C18_53810 [Saprospiraceae bacterium]
MLSQTDLTYINLYISYLILAIQLGTIILFISRYESFSKSFYIFTGFLAFSFIITSVSLFLWHNGENNLPLLHLYTLGEFLLLSWFYKEIIGLRNFSHLRFYIFIGLITVLLILNSIFVQPISQFNTYAKTLVQIVLIAYSIFYFYYLTNREDTESSEQKSLRLINSAMIVYYSGSLFIFMFSNYFIERTDNLIFWVFNSLLNLIFNLLVLVAIWRAAPKRMKSLF